MYLDGVQVPVVRAKVQMKIKGRNKTLTLISGEEVNLLKAAGLTEVPFELLLPSEPAKAAASPPPRPAGDASKAKTYTVVKGDCLWNIAKKLLGDGSRYTEIYSLNKDKVKNPHLIFPGQVLTLPE